MSKKLNKIVIIVFATVLVSSIFYGINKFNQKENYIEASSKNSEETNCLLDINNYKSVRYILDDKNNKENKEDEETKSNYKYVTWNLQSLYPSDEAWEKDLSKFEKDISELDNYTGKVTKSKTHFISALKIKEKLDIKLEKLYAYAKLNKDINKNSYKYLDMINKIGTVDSKYSRICSDLELEILKLPDSTYNEYLKSKKENKRYKMYLEEIRKSKEHYLDEKSEDIINKMGNIVSLPSNVYDLFTNMDKNSESLHKYISLRKKLLNIEKVHYYDMFAPIVEEQNSEISYDKAISLAYAALGPLGDQYEDIAYKAFNEKWVDVYSNENKVGGGYCLSVYANHPYILLNYDNSLDSVSTLVHELGHGVYSYLSQKNQKYYNAQPSIFTHEVASTTNEALLYEFLIKNAGNDKQKAYYITQYMDFIKDTLYTQTMYAEFERDVHSMLENNENVNTLVLNDLWSQLLKKYYGKDFEVDPLAMIGWSRIPHFYNSFYVYKYATGCSSAISFSQDILKNGPENYMNFLKKGSSDKPINLLKSAGIDLSNKKTIQVSIDKFNSLLQELEKLTNN